MGCHAHPNWCVFFKNHIIVLINLQAQRRDEEGFSPLSSRQPFLMWPGGVTERSNPPPLHHYQRRVDDHMAMSRQRDMT
jgi:hypothetical protein